MSSFHKYMDIIAWVRSQLAEGAFVPGDRFLSEAELGQRFCVSRQTVRRALDELARDGLIVRVQGSGTFIAGAPSPRPSERNLSASLTIGIISLYLNDYIFPAIIRGIESVLTAGGHKLLLISTQNEIAGETRALQLMLDSRPAGLIVEPTKSGLPCVNLHLYQRLARLGIPVIFTDSCYSDLNAPYVALDDVSTGYFATKHLIEMGHRRILGVFSHSNRAGSLRYSGYMRALMDHSIPPRDDFVHWYDQDDMGTILQGEPMSAALPQATAAVCYNDDLAASLMDNLKLRGLQVPRDFSLISIDNTPLARLNNLSCLVHPGERLGEAAANLLLSMLRGAPGKNILFPPELVSRHSVLRLEV